MKREELLEIAKPILFNTEMVRAILDGRKTQTRRVVKPRSRKACGFYVTVKRGVLGVYDYDENERMFDNPQPLPYYPGDILYVRETWCKTDCLGLQNGYVYKANNNQILDQIDFVPKWRPSIHMPKEAARIFLKVISVRVERLQQIDYDGAVAEGLEIGAYFDELWDSTIKKADRNKYVWDANPYVWVIKFKKIKRYRGGK